MSTQGVSPDDSAQAAITQARALADEGQFNQAIEHLSAVNRNARSRDIDRALLSLRSEGFLAQDWNIETPQWPTDLPDEFDGEGIPRIKAAELTAEAVHSGIANRGSLIVEGLLTKAQADQQRENIDRALQAFDETASGSVTQSAAGWYEPFHRDTLTKREVKRNKGAMMTADSPPALFDLLEVFDATGLSKVIREFFGEPPLAADTQGHPALCSS